MPVFVNMLHPFLFYIKLYNLVAGGVPEKIFVITGSLYLLHFCPFLDAHLLFAVLQVPELYVLIVVNALVIVISFDSCR